MTRTVPDTMLVGEMMRRWPQTARVLLDRRMRCPGCLLAPFMTVADAAAEHGVDLAALRADLAAAIADEPESDTVPESDPAAGRSECGDNRS